MVTLIVVGVIIALVVIVVLIFVGMYNGLVRSRNRVKEAWSGIDVQLRRRASLIPNLVETVKGYAEHERETFEEVTRARSQLEQAQQGGSPADAALSNNMLTGALRHLFAVAENYPQLQADENFRQLQAELSDIEEKIAFSRQFYNANVLDYNNRIQTVPTVFIAGMFGFTQEEFFEADEEARAEVRVDFSRDEPAATPAPAPPAAGSDNPGDGGTTPS
ncbi:MAG TPA: LemA family protein [Dehalococcoidia bacterium]|nr:LemA family protein [Dehalococcoidia bacterium]